MYKVQSTTNKAYEGYKHIIFVFKHRTWVNVLITGKFVTSECHMTIGFEFVQFSLFAYGFIALMTSEVYTIFTQWGSHTQNDISVQNSVVHRIVPGKSITICTADHVAEIYYLFKGLFTFELNFNWPDVSTTLGVPFSSFSQLVWGSRAGQPPYRCTASLSSTSFQYPSSLPLHLLLHYGP